MMPNSVFIKNENRIRIVLKKTIFTTLSRAQWINDGVSEWLKHNFLIRPKLQLHNTCVFSITAVLLYYRNNNCYVIG